MTRFNIKGKAQGKTQVPSSAGIKNNVVVSGSHGTKKFSNNQQENQSKVTQLREKSLKRDKWNLFSLVPNSVYSIRLYYLAQFLFDIMVIGYDQCAVEGCFLLRCFVCLITLASLFSTTKYAKRYQPRHRQLMMMTLPLYWTLRIVDFQDGKNDMIVGFLFYLPTFLISIFIIADWIEYLIFSAATTALIPLIYFYTFTFSNEFNLLAFYLTSIKCLVFYVIVFTLFEKVKKEQFVIGYTNSQTKKLLLSLFNSAPNPIVIVTQDGQIQFCNQTFETMLTQRLGIKSLPQSIYKITCEDEDSTHRLKCMIHDILKPQSSQNNAINMTNQNLKNSENSFYGGNINSGINYEKTSYVAGNRKVEIKIGKTLKKQNEHKKTVPEKKEETKSNSTISDRNTQFQKDMFEKFEIAQVTGEQVNFVSKRTVMLTFNIVSEQKAKNRLIYLHSQLMFRFLHQFNKKLQQMNQRAMNEEDVMNNSSIVEFLGTTYVAINQVQQMQHEFFTRSDNYKGIEENFLLRDEIMQCVESLSVKCLNASTTLKLDASKNLPEKLKGDIQRFRLALQAVSEFSMRYCTEGMIEIVINFDTMTTDGNYQIAFDFTFSKNLQYNEEPLVNLLNAMSRNSNMYEDILLRNYEDLFDLIQQFGIGMLIFPTLIAQLEGSYSITVIDSLEPAEEQKQDNLLGEQDQARPLSNANAKPGKIKILFKLAFANGEVSKKVMSPYTPINKTKFSQGMQNRDKARSQMRRIMGQNRSPLVNAAPRGHSVNDPIQRTEFRTESAKHTENDQSINLYNIIHVPSGQQDNNLNSNHLENQSFSNISFQQNNVSQNMGSSQNKFRKNSAMVTPAVDMNIVKKVETKLKNFEQRNSDGSKDFFKNQPQIIHTNSANLIEEKQGMENTTSRKNSQQIMPLNTILQKKPSDLAPQQNLDACHRVQSLNYIAHPQQFSNSSLQPGLNIETQQSNVSKFNQGSQEQLKGNKNQKKSTFIKFGNLDEELSAQDVSSGKKENDAHRRQRDQMLIKATQDALLIHNNQNSNNLIHSHSMNVTSGQPQFSGVNLNDRGLKQKNGSNQHIKQGLEKIEEKHNEEEKRFDRDNFIDSFLLENQSKPDSSNKTSQNQIAQLDNQLLGNVSRISSKTFKAPRTINPQEILAGNTDKGTDNFAHMAHVRPRRGYNPNAMQQQHQQQQKNSNFESDDLRKVLSFGQGQSSRGNKGKGQDDIQNLFINNQNSNANRNHHSDNALAHNYQNQVNLAKQESKQQQPMLSMNQEPIHIHQQQNQSNILRFGEQSPIILDTDGLENFDSEQISEDDASEILAQLSQMQDDSFIKNQYGNGNQQNNYQEEFKQPIDKFTMQNHHDNSFDNGHPMNNINNTLGNSNPNNMSGFDPNKTQDMQQRNNRFSKGSKRKGGNLKNEPLSKHIPKDILHTNNIGASKNLLSASRNYDNNYNNSLPNVRNSQLSQAQDSSPGHNKIVTPDQRHQRQSSINDEQPYRKPGKDERLRNSKQGYIMEQDEFFPYKRGQKTLQYQHNLLKRDFEAQKIIQVWDSKAIEYLQEEWEKLYQLYQPNQKEGSFIPPCVSGIGQRPKTFVDIGKRYVLVAEDNLMISTVIQEVLKSMDYVAIVALNGKIAVEKFTSFMKDDMFFDLILMDIFMPEMGGYEATENIRKIEQDFRITDQEKHYICGFSAECDERTLQKCLQAGMNELKEKPMTKDDLERLLNKCKRHQKPCVDEALGNMDQPSRDFMLDQKDLTILPGRAHNYR